MKKNFTLWLALLVIDRIIKHIAISSFLLETGVWYANDLVFLGFFNAFNPNLTLGLMLPYPSIAHPTLCGVSVIGVTGFSNYLKIDITKSLPPIVFGMMSNILDRFIWGAVSDPFVVAVFNVGAIMFNLADILILAGLLLYARELLKNV